MKFAGILLLLAGWAIVLTAVIILTAGAARAVFIVAGLAVQFMGLALLIRSHSLLRGQQR
jgi:hypothetical protein